MEELVELILKVNQEVKKEIPKLNWGGCGVFASKMYKQLKELGYTPNIVILDYEENDFSQKKEVLNNKMNKQSINGSLRSTSFAHCCLEIGGLYFDGQEIGQDFINRWKRRFPIKGNYTIEELDLALKVGSWNDAYSRKRKNPTLDKIIRKSIKQIFT